jgi:hypothetical protein
MYISLAPDVYLAGDSCAKGFRKWADAHEPGINKDVGAGEGDGVVATDPDLVDAVVTSSERPHRPWLVPGAGTL